MNRGSGRFSTVVVGIALGLVGWLLRQAPGDGPARWWPWLVLAGAGLVLVVVVVAVRRALVRLSLTSAGLLAGGVWLSSSAVPVATPGRGYWLPAVLVGGVVLLLIAGRVLSRRTGSVGLIDWWSWRNRRNGGVASAWRILRTSSWWAARRKARILRPSLRRVSWRRRWFGTPIRELATPLARVGALRVWSPIEDVTVRIGGPRTGKTGELACRILDAPGAVIATSTRTDLVELTGPCRRRRGPVLVFNPCGLAGLASTITFDPLSGCEQPTTATTRAADLLAGVSAPGGGGGDREFWSGQARRVLAALMHAAALGGASMRDVLAWVANPEDAAGEVSRFLRRSPEPAWESDAAQFLSTNDRTRSSITSTIMPALGWLTDSTAVAAATGEFDVAALLERRGTVYMLGAEEAQVAPLVTALTGHIAREARRLAAQQPAGRLDPPLTLALDEAALICPIPLDAWTADMGGRNVTIHIAAQSRAQLRARWGDTGAAAILNNAATLLIFGGTRDPEDLNAYSTLTGERWQRLPADRTHADRVAPSVQRVPVLSPGQIAQLPARRVLIVRRGMAPAIGRVRMAWRRHDVKAVARGAAIEAALARWGRRLSATRTALRIARAQARAWWGELTGQLSEWAERRAAARVEVPAPRAALPAGTTDEAQEPEGSRS